MTRLKCAAARQGEAVNPARVRDLTAWEPKIARKTLCTAGRERLQGESKSAMIDAPRPRHCRGGVATCHTTHHARARRHDRIDF